MVEIFAITAEDPIQSINNTEITRNVIHSEAITIIDVLIYPIFDKWKQNN